MEKKEQEGMGVKEGEKEMEEEEQNNNNNSWVYTEASWVKEEAHITQLFRENYNLSSWPTL